MAKVKLESVGELVVSDLCYLPTHAQREAKSAFLKRYQDNPLADPTNITLNMVQAILRDPRIDRWWGEPGFREWFTNSEEWREQAENLAFLAMDALKAILIDPNERGVTKVAAAKAAFEIAGKTARKSEGTGVGSLEKAIADMGKDDLIKFIQARAPRLLSDSSGSK